MTGRRVLIFDDDADVGQTIQWIAESLGFEAEFVSHPDEFFKKLADSQPDVVTIDLVMPEFDGVEILRKLAAESCRSKIVISSGMGAKVLSAAERSATEHGLNIAGVLSKPITRDSLRALIGEGSDSGEATFPAAGGTLNEQFDISETDLKRALVQREFVLAYQPKIDCQTGSIAGFEAIARWNHPVWGIVLPDQFIALAERSGNIDALTQQIFEQSLTWFSGAFPKSDLQLSLNLSARSLVDIQMADTLFQLCTHFRIATESVVLELTESSAMVDPTLSLDLMTRLRVKGFCLSIDDFGTGFSSMVQLVRLPFSEIKIDKSFVMQSRRSQEARSVIRSIIDLGHSLGLQVTAEGVEDSETFKYLKSLGCDFAQGYWIARPMWSDTARDWAVQRLSTHPPSAPPKPNPDRLNLP